MPLVGKLVVCECGRKSAMKKSGFPVCLKCDRIERSYYNEIRRGSKVAHGTNDSGYVEFRYSLPEVWALDYVAALQFPVPHPNPGSWWDWYWET